MLILDCTLRDGGYYNKWNFSNDVANRYLRAMSSAKVDIVELGLRSLQNDDFKGPNAFTSDTYLAHLEIPKNLKVSVMVNASELVNSSDMWKIPSLSN